MYSQLGNVVIMGDFNAHLNGRTQNRHIDSRGNALRELTGLFDILILTTSPSCTVADNNYVIYDGNSTTLIDHVIISSELQSWIRHCEILDDDSLSVSCHRPIVFNIVFSCQLKCRHDEKLSVRWDKVTDFQKLQYAVLLHDKLKVSVDQLSTADIHGCVDQLSTADIHGFIDGLYASIVKSIHVATETCLPRTTYRSYLKPYWSGTIKKHHANMRFKRMVWIYSGRPRGAEHESYGEYKEAKYEFQKYHRKCCFDYMQKINNDIDNASETDSPLFWRLLNAKRNKMQRNICNEIEFNGYSLWDPELICKEWCRHFSELYSDTDSDQYDINHFDTITDSLNSLKGCIIVDNDHITYEVVQALRAVKLGKMCGFDNICNEHIIHGGILLKHYLTLLINLMYYNSYVPLELKRRVILILYKGSGKPENDSSSHRVITLSSSILKLYERILLSRLESSINRPLNALQRAFKPTWVVK